MNGEQRRREWNRLNEMLETPDHHGLGSRRLEGYQIIRPRLNVAVGRGSLRQLSWALENWVRPYLNRVRAGIEYDPRLHRMPAEPDWRVDRGRSNLVSRLAVPYGDDWESLWIRRGKKRAAARRRARD